MAIEDAFADDDEDRIVGLDMHFEGSRPPRWVRELLASEARYNEADLTGPESDG